MYQAKDLHSNNTIKDWKIMFDKEWKKIISEGKGYEQKSSAELYLHSNYKIAVMETIEL